LVHYYNWFDFDDILFNSIFSVKIKAVKYNPKLAGKQYVKIPITK